ncbi:MAG TPA: hydroxyphenylacetyl-CoA thioesterase PaaI [Stellaceae bacterium]|jgi:acyl-CoA thioesterase|nr:hydroxyphenylacetyl-CoA thioesterase PaaI [Stellaceae bacterium]
MMDGDRPEQRLAEAVGRAMLALDEASRALGMVVEEIAPGTARLSMNVRDNMINGHDLCHGGLIFTLADSALAFASNARNQVTVAAAAEIQFVSPARKGETLVAVARERASMGRSGIYDIEVTDRASGRLVALFRGRAHRIEGRIVEEDPA